MAAGDYALIAAMSDWVPTMFMTRVRLQAKTCRAISVLHHEMRRAHPHLERGVMS
jgi:hypothetical protein